MIGIVRTNSENTDFIQLVAQLDKLLADLDGRDHDFYNQYNKIDKIKHVILAYDDNLPVACGAIKEFDTETMEVKRMFTLNSHRGNGFATQVLTELENWALELGYSRCVLETGKRLPEAVRLYEKSGYQLITNYGQYVAMENSICFEKRIKKPRLTPPIDKPPPGLPQMGGEERKNSMVLDLPPSGELEGGCTFRQFEVLFLQIGRLH